MKKQAIIDKILFGMADLEIELYLRSQIHPANKEKDKNIKNEYVKGQASVLRMIQDKFSWVKNGKKV